MRAGLGGAATILTAWWVPAALAASPVKADLKLAPFNPQAACAFGPATLKVAAGPIPAGAHVLLARCGVTGALKAVYSGVPRAQGAVSSWNWYLEVGKDGKTTGVAAEYGAATLSLPGGPVTLVSTGIQQPVGPQTATHARGLSKGPWKATTGKGSGTYTFTTERTGSTFTTATIHLTGSLG